MREDPAPAAGKKGWCGGGGTKREVGRDRGRQREGRKEKGDKKSGEQIAQTGVALRKRVRQTC